MQDDFAFRPIEDANLFSHGRRVKSKVVVITGAAGGIGREAAKKFAEHGCALSFCWLQGIASKRLSVQRSL